MEKVIEKWPSTIEQGDDIGWTPLHIVAHMGNGEFVKLLLEKGDFPAYVRNKLRRFICSSHCGQGMQLWCNGHTHDSMSGYLRVVAQQGPECSLCRCRK